MNDSKNIDYKVETVISYGKKIHYIHSHHHYFQLLLPKSIHCNVIPPLKIYSPLITPTLLESQY